MTTKPPEIDTTNVTSLSGAELTQELLRGPTPDKGGGGGDGPMEPRVAKLESDVEYIQRDVSDIKADLREIRNDIKALSKLVSDTKSEIASARGELKSKVSYSWMLAFFAGLTAVILREEIMAFLSSAP